MDFTISLPDWAAAELACLPERMPSLADRMREVIRFSKLNIENGTGGPFAAGVFERGTGRLVAMGVNRVVPLHCSSAHAEIVALSLAQKKLGTFDLGGAGQPDHQLVVNCLPCAMCFGAVLWSGVRSVAIGTSGPEVEQITGFDEGPIHPQWREELAKRKIELIENLQKEQALEVFKAFSASGALVYNARQKK